MKLKIMILSIFATCTVYKLQPAAPKTDSVVISIGYSTWKPSVHEQNKDGSKKITYIRSQKPKALPFRIQVAMCFASIPCCCCSRSLKNIVENYKDSKATLYYNESTNTYHEFYHHKHTA